MKDLKKIKRFNESESENWRSDLTRKITKEDIIDIIKSNTAEDAADEILEIMSIMTSTSGR
jgi:predicted AAA+ superfamily ATPase